MFSVANTGDMGFWWRTQTPRSMADLDRLIQLKLSYGKAIGEDKAKEIEQDINLFSDFDQFRKYHAVGRFRGTLCSLLFTTTLFTYVSGGTNGYGAMRRQPLLTAATFASSWVVFYTFWSRKAGFTNQKYNEF